MAADAPRRARVERGIYRRSTGTLEVGYRDETGRQRWRTVDGGILAARKVRDDLSARRARGESIAPKAKLRFGAAASAWLDGPVLDLRDTTQAKYRCMIREHLNPRFEQHRLDSLAADDTAKLVRDLRAEGKSEATIAVILSVVGHVYKFAARRLGWTGTIPTTLMLRSERPKISATKRRPIFTGEQLEQTIAAAHEPFRTLFVVAALTGARISELCGLTWTDVRLSDLEDAEIEFGLGRPARRATADQDRRIGPHGADPGGARRGSSAAPADRSLHHARRLRSQLVLAGRCSNRTCPGRYASHNGAPWMQTDTRRFRPAQRRPAR
jgi:hypothetical protein